MHSRRQINNQVKKALETAKDTSGRYWRSQKNLTTIYDQVKDSKVKGVSFFGHKSWYAYLRNEIGQHPVSLKDMHDNQLNHYINLQIQKGINLEASSWDKAHEPVMTNGLTLSKLYGLIRYRKKDGKNFIGYGGWYEYLEKVHGVNPTSPLFMPDNRVHQYISLQLKQGVQTEAKFWSRDTEPVAPTGHSLQSLYTLANKRKIRGKTFFGYGSWSEYLDHYHKIPMPRYRKTVQSKVYSNDEVHKLIGEQIRENVNLDSSYWRNQKKLVNKYGQSLSTLLRLARTRKSRKTPYFGHGNWYTYLEKVHGVSSLSSRNMPNNRLNFYVTREIRKRVNPSATFWQSSFEPISPAGHSLKALYELVKKRKARQKQFLGFGNWKDYLNWLGKEF